MKKIITSLAVVLSLSFSSIAQNNPQPERCATVNYIEYMDSKMPGYKDAVDKTYQKAIERSAQKSGPNDIYYIPVVVHIVYHNDAENLHDSVVHAQIESLNEDYMRWNADTIDMRDTFKTIAGSPNIQFYLATTDPDGNPTTGITRTSTSTNFGRTSAWFPDLETIEEVKSSTTGGADLWDTLNYLNIWVSDLTDDGTDPSLLGYATPPAGLSNWPSDGGGTDDLLDGVVIQYQVFGRNNPNTFSMPGSSDDYLVMGRTVTHEVGHYLGLRHISGDPGWFDQPCTADDGLSDTPSTKGQSDFDCDKVKNTCTDNFSNGLGNLPDMVENFMDYSNEICQNSFSKGQIGIMRSVLENERLDLVTAAPSAGTLVKDLTLKIPFNLLPNPTNGNITIESAQIGRVVLLNQMGQEIESGNKTTDYYTIDLSEKANGLYFVKFINETGTITKKVIKQ